jgi:hypothetical protein
MNDKKCCCINMKYRFEFKYILKMSRHREIAFVAVSDVVGRGSRLCPQDHGNDHSIS